MIYQRPPVTEAILEILFFNPIPYPMVGRIKSKLAPDYSQVDETRNYNFNLDFESGKAKVDSDATGVRVANKLSDKVRIISVNGIIFSQLGLYSGWNEFISSIKKDWEQCCDAMGSIKQLGRIGLRFLNRIDIPNSALSLEVNDYLNINILIPQPPFGPLSTFAVHANLPIGNDNECELLLNVAPIKSPLIGHRAVILDIDVGKLGPNSSDTADLWALLERMRNYKNQAFEAAVTDQSRRLFGDVR
jgi:uncharacterized protein (TIGR04255 family)